MYTFSNRLKTVALVFMVLGLVGIAYGFFAAPKTTQDVEKIMAESSHGGHGEVKKHDTHDEAAIIEDTNHENHVAITEAHTVSDTMAHGGTEMSKDSLTKEVVAPVVSKSAQKEEVHDEHASHQEHLEHVLHQLQNKPWSALYVAALFFMLMSLGVLAFYAINVVAQAGWAPILFRVMQGITAYLPVGSIIFFILLILASFHVGHNHIFVWMDPELIDPTNIKYDKLLAGKSGYLNVTMFLIRAAIFLIGWNAYRYFSRKNCLAQDDASDNFYYKKNFKLSALFLVFFIVTESIMSWDWIMSVDPHWFSTLFGWYVFSSFVVSGITAIALVATYLKSRGYLEHVNTSHIHDLAKYMFGFSIFWTYLWFSQFMLIWYSNIPEEVTYFVTRIEQYNLPFFGMLILNFIFPFLILINSDFKRISWVIVMAGFVILFGHYIDFFTMIMPATVGENWFIGIPELSALLFFLGLFIFVVFSALTKAPLVPKRNPYIEESKHFHY